MNEEDDFLFKALPSDDEDKKPLPAANENHTPTELAQKPVLKRLTIEIPALQRTEVLYLEEKDTVAELKTRIQEQQTKFDSRRDSLMFKGKILTDQEIIGDLIQKQPESWGIMAPTPSFYAIIKQEHLEEAEPLIETIPPPPRIQEVQPGNPPNMQPAAAAQAPPLQRAPSSGRPLTRDEILVTDQYTKYERDVIKEYERTVSHLIAQAERVQSKRRDIPQHHYQELFMDTNMSAESNFLLSHMPIMEQGFQQRLGIYSAQHNIRNNLSEFNENNNAIQFLGYDSLIQPTLIMKLFGFMLIFGMSSPGKLKWVCLLITIAYYFAHVRSLYITHYEQQKRLLALNNVEQVQAPQPLLGNVEDPNLAQNQINRGIRENQRQVVVLPLFLVIAYAGLRVVKNLCILIYYLFVSLHHDWIDPVIRRFDEERAAALRAAERINQQRREEQERQRVFEEALLQQRDDPPNQEAGQDEVDPAPARQPVDFAAKLVQDDDDPLFDLEGDDLTEQPAS